MAKETLSVSQFAKSTGISLKYAFDLARLGRLGATKDERGHWATPSEALAAFMRARKARQKANAALASLSATAPDDHA